MGQQKDVKKLIHVVQNMGWSLEMTKKKWKIRHPRGRLVSFSATPSDTNAIHQIRRDINRVLKSYGETTL